MKLYNVPGYLKAAAGWNHRSRQHGMFLSHTIPLDRNCTHILFLEINIKK